MSRSNEGVPPPGPPVVPRAEVEFPDCLGPDRDGNRSGDEAQELELMNRFADFAVRFVPSAAA